MGKIRWAAFNLLTYDLYQGFLSFHLQSLYAAQGIFM